MRYLLITTGALLMASVSGGADGNGADDSTARPRDGWRLVWADEFDDDGHPDAGKWVYEEGFVRNREQQYYTKRRPENARVEDGRLILECRKERYPNPRYEEGAKDWRKRRRFAEYTAASLTTQGKASWRYGRFEMRAKLPRGRGAWPAFWTLGTNRTEIGWPRCGEIDIMEFVGKQPDTVHANAHFARDGEHASKKGELKVDAPYDGFHVYAIEWFEDRIDFYFDRTKYHTVKLETLTADDDAFARPHYLLVNFAIGGTWGGEIDDDVLPQRYEIDYVRVYERQ